MKLILLFEKREGEDADDFEKTTKVIGNYSVLKKLGEGSFSKVYLTINNDDFNRYAIKDINLDLVKASEMETQLHREISILYQMDHPGLIKLYEVMRSPSHIYLVLEYAPGGELFDILANSGPLEEDVARMYYQQLIDALDSMHSKKATHRDLKPENLLLDANGNLKIADFGLSIMSHSTSSFLKTRCGTPNYVAPEVLVSDGYKGPSADLWSSGCILFVMLTALLPFDAPTLKELAQKILNLDLVFPPWISDQALDLLQHILVVDPQKRYTIKDIKNHPWFKINYHPIVSESTGPSAPFTYDMITELDENGMIVGSNTEPTLVMPSLELNMLMPKEDESLNQQTKFTTHKTVEKIDKILNHFFTKHNITTVVENDTINASLKMTDDLFMTISIKDKTETRQIEVHRMKGNTVDFLNIYKKLKNSIKKNYHSDQRIE